MANGFPLNVPSLTLPPPGATPPLSNANGPTVTAPIQNPPTGVPLTFGAPGSSSNVSIDASATQPSTTQPSTSGGDGGGTTPTSEVTVTPSGHVPGTSGAIGVGDNMSMLFLFSLCLIVVLLA